MPQNDFPASDNSCSCSSCLDKENTIAALHEVIRSKNEIIKDLRRAVRSKDLVIDELFERLSGKADDPLSSV